MLRNPVERKGKWTEIPRAVKSAAHRTRCPICGRDYGYIVKVLSKVIRVREALDHVFPRRWITEKFPEMDPHRPENILSICNLCHGAKRIAEDALFRGDALSFLKQLYVMRYPMDRVAAMAKILNLTELECWK